MLRIGLLDASWMFGENLHCLHANLRNLRTNYYPYVTSICCEKSSKMLKTANKRSQLLAKVGMNSKDREILRWLQRDGSLSMDMLSEKVSLSKTAVWRRVRNLEGSGLLQKRVALVDRKLAGFGVNAFALVSTNQHNDEWVGKLRVAVSEMPEIVEFHRASGNVDYVLRIVAKDMDDYDRVYQRLIKRCDFADISSTFIMETIKETTVLPL